MNLVFHAEQGRATNLGPHPEERRIFAARLEEWPLARPCLLPSFETAAQEGDLLRMRSEICGAPPFGMKHQAHLPK